MGENMAMAELGTTVEAGGQVRERGFKGTIDREGSRWALGSGSAIEGRLAGGSRESST